MNVLFILFGLLLLPSAEAQNTADICSRISNAPGLSPYVQEITQRVQQALNSAAQNPSPTSPGVLENEISQAQTALHALISPSENLSRERDALLKHTACLQYDALIIECHMANTQTRLLQAIAQGNAGAISRLRKLLPFLNDRLLHLRQGGTDPSYEDGTWAFTYGFDSVGTQRDPICPFYSDYLPPGIGGYGCDEIALRQIRTTLSSVTTERQAIERVGSTVDRQQQVARQIADLLREIADLLGQSVSIPEHVAIARTHKTLSGCIPWVRTCSRDPSRTCETHDDCREENAGACLDRARIGVCENDPSTRCLRNNDCPVNAPIPGQEANAGSCMNLSFATFEPLRGAFSFEKNELNLLRAFEEQRAREGGNREQSSNLESKPFLFALDDPIKNIGRETFRAWNTERGRQEAALFALGSDPVEQIMAALKPLRKPVQRLAFLASDKQGLRSFVRKFAFFLRRTCIFRPCNKQLESIITIALTDACFPYTNGEYLDDTCEDNRAAKCIEAAKGVNEDFPFDIPQPTCRE